MDRPCGREGSKGSARRWRAGSKGSEGGGRRPLKIRGASMKNRTTALAGEEKSGTPFGGWRHHLSPAKAGALWVLDSGVK